MILLEKGEGEEAKSEVRNERKGGRKTKNNKEIDKQK